MLTERCVIDFVFWAMDAKRFTGDRVGGYALRWTGGDGGVLARVGVADDGAAAPAALLPLAEPDRCARDTGIDPAVGLHGSALTVPEGPGLGVELDFDWIDNGTKQLVRFAR